MQLLSTLELAFIAQENLTNKQSISYNINNMFQTRPSQPQPRRSRLSTQESEPFLQAARQNFVKKVYSTLSIQLILTTLIVYYATVSYSFAYFLNNNTWLFWISFLGALITIVALQFGNISSIFPTNFYVMTVFTICESMMVAYCCTEFESQSILLSALATLSASCGLTYFAMTTKQDFTSSAYIGKGLLYSFVSTITAITLINLIFIRSGLIAYILSIGFAIVYSLYLLIDTQLILGNRQKRINLDDYIWGATKLYTDIIAIFLRLLQILGKRNRKDE